MCPAFWHCDDFAIYKVHAMKSLIPPLRSAKQPNVVTTFMVLGWGLFVAVPGVHSCRLDMADRCPKLVTFCSLTAEVPCSETLSWGIIRS